MNTHNLRAHQMQEIKEKLIDLAFEEARMRNLARSRTQIRIAFDIRDSETLDLEDSDWAELLSMKELTAVEREFILRLKNGQNNPLNPYRFGFSYEMRRAFQKKIQAQKPNYRLAKVSHQYCIKKTPSHDTE